VASITREGWKCERCGHEWTPRKEEPPEVCPSCNSPYWNRPRKGAGNANPASGVTL